MCVGGGVSVHVCVWGMCECVWGGGRWGCVCVGGGCVHLNNGLYCIYEQEQHECNL